MKKPINLSAIAFARVNKLAKEVEEIKKQIRDQNIQPVEKTEDNI